MDTDNLLTGSYKTSEELFRTKELLDTIPDYTEEELRTLTEDSLLGYYELMKYKRDFKKYNKLLYFTPDEWFNKVTKVMENEAVCGVIAGNRSGKSYSSTWLYATLLTGIYSPTYSGYKYTTGIDTWVLTTTSEQYAQAGGLQQYLFGDITTGEIGTGWIPRDRILKTELGIGVKGFIKKAYILSDDGTISKIEFKSYSQNLGALMGASISFALVDEELSMEVLSQVVTRTATPRTGNGTGRVLVSMTPEKGSTEVVNSFFEGHYLGGLVRGTVWDVSFLTEEDIEGMKKRYPVHQWDMRLKGLPTLGDGAVFPDLDKVQVKSINIDVHDRIVAAVDFGVSRDPSVVMMCSYNPDDDTYYLFNEVYEVGMTSSDMGRYIANSVYPKIPTVTPHDGNTLTGEGGSTKAVMMKNEGANVLTQTFYNPPELVSGVVDMKTAKRSNSIEAGLEFIRYLMRTNKLIVDPSCTNWLSEARKYNYVKNKPVDKDNHAIDAARYAILSCKMRGIPAGQCTNSVSAQDFNNGFYNDDYAPTLNY